MLDLCYICSIFQTSRWKPTSVAQWVHDDFRSPKSGADHDWVTAKTFDELVTKVDRWCNEVFMWMGGMVRGTE
jgi:hypothetical protein